MTLTYCDCRCRARKWNECPGEGHPDCKLSAEPTVCPYCKKPDAGWLSIDLRHGKRFKNGVLEYHCYDGYALD